MCGELDKDLKLMVKYSVEVCRKRDLKVNGDKNKEVLGKEDGLVCETLVDRT